MLRKIFQSSLKNLSQFPLKRFSESSIQKTSNQNELVQTFEEMIFDQELKEISVQQTQELRESSRLYLQQWINDRKTIFEGDIEHNTVLRYQILAGLFGALFLYMLYRGDSKYKYIILVPTFAGFCGFMAIRNQAKNAIPYIQQISLHKCGSKLDVVLSQNQAQNSLMNIPIQQVKLLRGDNFTKGGQAPNKYLKAYEEGDFQYNLSSVRTKGLATDAQFIQVDGTFYALPFQSQRNNFALDFVFNGKNVEVQKI